MKSRSGKPCAVTFSFLLKMAVSKGRKPTTQPLFAIPFPQFISLFQGQL